MQLMRNVVVISSLLVFLFSASAFGDDLNPPTWRGYPDTTVQFWEFDDNDNPALPEYFENIFGDPLALIEEGFPYTRWLATDLGHDGVWVTEDFILLDIPNTENTDPRSYKEIYLQMTYYTENGVPPQIATIPDPDPLTLEPIYTEVLDDYVYSIWDIIIRPNPLQESIYILPRNCPMFVDQIRGVSPRSACGVV